MISLTDIISTDVTDLTVANCCEFPTRGCTRICSSQPPSCLLLKTVGNVLHSSLPRRFNPLNPPLLHSSSAVLCHLHRWRHRRCLGDPHFLSSGCASPT